jgi:hypothetical protein
MPPSVEQTLELDPHGRPLGDQTSRYGEGAGGTPKHTTDSFTSQNDLLIRGFGVRVPGDARTPNSTACLPGCAGPCLAQESNLRQSARGKPCGIGREHI